MNKINYRRCAVTKRHLGVALCAVSVLTPLFLISSVKAQQPLIRPDLQIRSLPKLQLQLQPELVSKLQASKPRVSAVELDKAFLVKNNRTFIKLANGEEKQLLPLSFMEKSPGVSTTNLPEEVSDAAPYIKSARISDAARTSIFKINPKLTIPLGVDNRSKMTPVKDQGPRGTCVAFASNAALEIWPSIPDDLSEQYSNDLFMRKESRPACEDGIVTTNAASYLTDGTVTEDKWGYTMSDPACNTTVPNAAATATKYKIAESQLISDGGPTGAASIKNPRYLEALLRSGQNIVLGTHVAWGAPNSKGVLDVVIDPATNSPAASRGGHAMLICGYNATGDYFIVKNSWGTGFGHNGYAYLSYDYIRTYAKYGYYIRKVSPALMIYSPKVNPEILQGTPKIRIPR